MSVASANPERLVFSPPEKLDSTSPIMMRSRVSYMNEDGVNVGPATFEFAICQGRIHKIEYGEDRIVWRLKLTLADPEDIKGIERLNNGIAEYIQKTKTSWGRSSVYRELTRVPRDPRTGYPYDGAQPMISLKIGRSSSFHQITVSQPVEFANINYQDLEGKKILCSTIMNIGSVLKVGETIMPQCYVVSCCILDILEQPRVDHRKSGILQHYLKCNPETPQIMVEKVNHLKERKKRPSVGVSPVLAPPKPIGYDNWRL